jgi:hypothetical protein
MSFKNSTVWQWQVKPSDPPVDYYLGLYNSKSWMFGTYGGLFTIGYKTINGDKAGCPQGNPRNSTIFLQCNENYNSSYPLIVSQEVTVCNCKFIFKVSIHTFKEDYILLLYDRSVFRPI